VGKIRILEDKIVNQIAAGEVVERPAAVLKELIENSLDANARCLEISLERGGRNLLSVADDGHGMDSADALMCLERHGTSKIRDANDLYRISSLGFRGEAIPSIAAVSRFNIVTRQHDSDIGTKVVIEGGVIKTREPVGCPIGTIISAKNLFFNVPVRRKFLRTVNTELSHCLEMVISQALIRPDVDWTVTHDGRVVLRAPVAKSRKERATTLLKGHGRALVPVSFTSGELSVEALISPVGVHQGAAKGSLYLYVNGRYVRDPLIRKAVREAYRHIVPKGRFPVVIMEITLPPDQVDVNIHPTKVD
jgi:DNA mismatch repair protein MutL